MRILKPRGPYFRLKVTLLGTNPPIWRRFLVPSGISLKRLHDSLQAVMGWTNSHMHQFEVDGVFYGAPDRESSLSCVSENSTTVDRVLRQPEDRLTYEYDFGDGWEHEVVLEAVVPPLGDGRYPVLEAGGRACPPEDIGGVFGYAEFLEILKNPKHPDHDEMLEWVGGPFDPEKFDVGEANLAIHGGWVRRTKAEG